MDDNDIQDERLIEPTKESEPNLFSIDHNDVAGLGRDDGTAGATAVGAVFSTALGTTGIAANLTGLTVPAGAVWTTGSAPFAGTSAQPSHNNAEPYVESELCCTSWKML